MASEMIITLTESNFAAEVLQAPVPVLVDFWAEWCAPCRMVAPLLEELAGEYDGQIRIGKVDIEKQQMLQQEYDIRGIPTLVLFKDGQVQDVIVGLKSKRDLKASIERVLTPA
ncbi:MAG TPA: thioredoxin [Verrucomicrobiota bacterium]|nr:thioredoxin [Verrucomicrobiota bacterium]HNU51442.1 thioredoxin [Verrucomicrobiota bacterium]